MKLSILTLLALAADHVCAFSPHKNKRDTPLQINLSPIGNSKINVSVTNTGFQGYNLFHTASLLDGDAPVDKFSVHRADTRAKFHGLLVQVSATNLSSSQFLPILTGQTISTTIDLAELYDVEFTDRYTIHATGSLPYAELNSTTLTGRSVAFSSNTIVMDIDGDEAAKIPYLVKLLNQKRTVLSCSGEREAVMKQALENCVMLASNASNAAKSGLLMQEYFKSTSSSVISAVSARFDAVAQECSSTISGESSVLCSDSTSDLCTRNGYIAYTNPNTNAITYCDYFYTSLTPLTSECGLQDQANTVVHETTHCPSVYSPYTLDYAYGEAVRDLSSEEAVRNADTYRMYAGAVYGNCAS